MIRNNKYLIVISISILFLSCNNKLITVSELPKNWEYLEEPNSNDTIAQHYFINKKLNLTYSVQVQKTNEKWSKSDLINRMDDYYKINQDEKLLNTSTESKDKINYMVFKSSTTKPNHLNNNMYIRYLSFNNCYLIMIQYGFLQDTLRNYQNVPLEFKTIEKCIKFNL